VELPVPPLDPDPDDPDPPDDPGGLLLGGRGAVDPGGVSRTVLIG
jgi:hypothetical protein